MKILIPIGAFYPDQSGGPSNTLYWIAKALVANKIEVNVFTTNRGISNLPLNRKIVTEYGNIMYCKTTIHYLPFKLIFETVKEIKKNDLIILTGFFYPPSLIIALFGLLKKKKIIWSPRGELYSNSLTFNRLLKRIMIFIIKKTISTKVVFHSSSSDESMTIINNLGKNVRIIEFPNYMILPEKEQRYSTEKYFLYLGRIQPDKTLEKLILGYGNSIKAKELQIPLKIAGDNNNTFAKTLEKLINDNNLSDLVHFMGYITGQQKQILFANAFFSFLLSDSENFGNVVIESMAQGTPVIASKNSPWEILEENKAGLWIENTPEKIGETIDKVLMMENEEYSTYRTNAINLVIEHFDVNKNISKWISLFNQMLNENWYSNK